MVENIACPKCRVLIPNTSTKCPYCEKFILQCESCGYPIYPDTEYCVRCSSKIVPYAELAVHIYVEEGTVVKKDGTINVEIENIGVIPTKGKYEFETNDLIMPTKFHDTFELGVDEIETRFYKFTTQKAGLCKISNIKIEFDRTSEEGRIIEMPPIEFQIIGTPDIDFEIESEEITVELKDKIQLFVKLFNKGSDSATDLKLNVKTSSELSCISPDIKIDKLDSNETRVALLLFESHFTGQYTTAINIMYKSSDNQLITTPEKKVLVNVI